MLVWAESNQPVNPWQPKLIFFPFWRNSPTHFNLLYQTRNYHLYHHNHRHLRHDHGYLNYYVRVITHTTTLIFQRIVYFSTIVFWMFFFFCYCHLKATFFSWKTNRHHLYCAPQIHFVGIQTAASIVDSVPSVSCYIYYVNAYSYKSTIL
jgi:hypothetical protein